MITIGSRTTSSHAIPGFSIQELREEAKRRGIPFNRSTSKHILRSRLEVKNFPDGTPKVIFHRSFGVWNDDSHIRIDDLDAGATIASWHRPGANLLGVTNSGDIVFTEAGSGNEVRIVSGEDFFSQIPSPDTLPKHLIGYEMKDLRVRIVVVSHVADFRPQFVFGNKLVFADGQAPNKRVLRTLDLVSQEDVKLFTGKISSIESRDGYVLIDTKEPREFILFDVKSGRELWRMDGRGVEEGFRNYLLGPKRFAVIGDPNAIFYTLIGDKWSEWKPLPQHISRIGLSKGRIIASRLTEIRIYDISNPSKLGGTFISVFPLSVTEPEAVDDSIFELRDGRIIYYSEHKNTQFLFDPDWETVDNLRELYRSYRLLPVRQVERKRFADLIASSAREIPKELAVLIEGFI